MTLMAITLGIEELGREVAGEDEPEWMVPLLVEDEREMLMAWQPGVSLLPDWGIAQLRRPL